MTSNLGSDLIQNLAGESLPEDKKYGKMKEAVMGVVGTHFRPEFINRIDEVVVFHPLAREQLRGIADIQIEQLRHRLLERELDLDISDEVMELLCDAGFDPVYGARPLKRTIQQMIENPLAQAVLAGKFVAGDTIKAVAGEDGIDFEVK